MPTREKIQRAALPLHRVAALLAQAAGDVKQGRGMQIDPDPLGDLIDGVLAALLRDRARRASALQGIAARASRWFSSQRNLPRGMLGITARRR
jgi:hypothetical protein